MQSTLTPQWLESRTLVAPCGDAPAWAEAL